MNRNVALELLHEHTKSNGLRKHALGVAAAMRYYAEQFGEDALKWEITGLLHDFDYEETPDPSQHPMRGAAILKEKGYPEDLIYAIKSHASYLGLERASLMDKTLFAVDELVGFITAVALIRPSKSVMEVTPEAVIKKMKAPAFARAVSREDIHEGAASLGMSLEEHISHVIRAMQGAM